MQWIPLLIQYFFFHFQISIFLYMIIHKQETFQNIAIFHLGLGYYQLSLISKGLVSIDISSVTIEPSSSRSMDEIERRFKDHLTQLQLQRNSDMDEIHMLLRALQIRLLRSPTTDKTLTIFIKTYQNVYDTRISKAGVPCFDGKNFCDWIYKCDKFFLLDETQASSMVHLASIHLDGLPF